jgi:hypothetical protein
MQLFDWMFVSESVQLCLCCHLSSWTLPGRHDFSCLTMKDEFLDEIGTTLPCMLDIWQIPVPFSKLLRSCMRRCRFAYLLHWSAKERLGLTLSRMWRYIGIVWGQRWHYKSIESLRPSNAKHIFTLFYILDGSAGTAVAHGNFWWNHCQVVLHAINSGI